MARIPRELLALLKDKYSSTVTARLLELLTERLAGSRFAAASLAASHDAGSSAGGGPDAALSLALLMPQLLGSPNDSLAPLASPVRPAPPPPSSSLADGGGARDAFEASACCCQFRTVAVLALSDEVPLASVALELQFALSPLCASLRLTSDIILQRLGAISLILVDSQSESEYWTHAVRVCVRCACRAERVGRREPFGPTRALARRAGGPIPTGTSTAASAHQLMQYSYMRDQLLPPVSAVAAPVRPTRPPRLPHVLDAPLAPAGRLHPPGGLRERRTRAHARVPTALMHSFSFSLVYYALSIYEYIQYDV